MDEIEQVYNGQSWSERVIEDAAMRIVNQISDEEGRLLNLPVKIRHPVNNKLIDFTVKVITGAIKRLENDSILDLLIEYEITVGPEEVGWQAEARAFTPDGTVRCIIEVAATLQEAVRAVVARVDGVRKASV